MRCIIARLGCPSRRGLQTNLAGRIRLDQHFAQVTRRQHAVIGALQACEFGLDIGHHPTPLRSTQLAHVVERVLGVVDQHFKLATPQQRIAFEQRYVGFGGDTVGSGPGCGFKGRAQVVHPCAGSPSNY